VTLRMVYIYLIGRLDGERKGGWSLLPVGAGKSWSWCFLQVGSWKSVVARKYKSWFFRWMYFFKKYKKTISLFSPTLGFDIKFLVYYACVWFFIVHLYFHWLWYLNATNIKNMYFVVKRLKGLKFIITDSAPLSVIQQLVSEKVL